MCEVLDRIENCGIDKGKAEGRIKGRTQVMALMKKLFEQNRIDDAKKASEDAAYYDRLLKELGIGSESCVFIFIWSMYQSVMNKLVFTIRISVL